MNYGYITNVCYSKSIEINMEEQKSGIKVFWERLNIFRSNFENDLTLLMKKLNRDDVIYVYNWKCIICTTNNGDVLLQVLQFIKNFNDCGCNVIFVQENLNMELHNDHYRLVDLINQFQRDYFEKLHNKIAHVENNHLENTHVENNQLKNNSIIRNNSMNFITGC